MKFKLPISARPKKGMVTKVMLRLPHDLHTPFNLALTKSNMSGQQLVEAMVRHCLKDAALNGESQ